MKKIIKRTLLVAGVLGVVAALAIASQPRPMEVDVARVRRGTLVVTVDEDGITRVKDRYVVSAPLAGRITRIEHRAGDLVRRGEVIAMMTAVEPPLIDARTKRELEARVHAAAAMCLQREAVVERARQVYQLARIEAERARDLGAHVTQQARDRAEMEERSSAKDLESAVFAARVAEHELETAKTAVDRMLSAKRSGESVAIAAPVEGSVLRVLLESEAVIGPGVPLLELGDPSKLEVVADVLTTDAVQIRKNARVSIDRWGGDRALAGHVRLTEPSGFTKVSALGIEEQRVNVIVELDDRPGEDAPIGDAYRVEARIEIYRAEDVVLAPAIALFREDDRWMVFVAAGDRAELRAVRVGRSNAVETEILSGLKEGELVVSSPSEKLREGTEIAPRPLPGEPGREDGDRELDPSASAHYRAVTSEPGAP